MSSNNNKNNSAEYMLKVIRWAVAKKNKELEELTKLAEMCEQEMLAQRIEEERAAAAAQQKQQDRQRILDEQRRK